MEREMDETESGECNHVFCSVSGKMKNPLIINKGSPILPHKNPKTRELIGEIDTQRLSPSAMMAAPKARKLRVGSDIDVFEEKNCETHSQSKHSLINLFDADLKLKCEKIPKEDDALKYQNIKKTLNGITLAKEIFSDLKYKSDIAINLEPKPAYTMQAYKYKLEGFTTEIQQKYAKDMTKFSDKKTLCLDFNNILMTISMYADETADEVIHISKENNVPPVDLSICYRPYLQDFLKDMRSHFELILYSSFNFPCLQAIVKSIEKNEKYFSYLFSEEFCVFANISNSIKCMDFLLGNRNPSNIIFVENTATSFPLSSDNVVPVPVFQGKGSQDSELIKLGCILETLNQEKDIPEAIRKYRELN